MHCRSEIFRQLRWFGGGSTSFLSAEGRWLHGRSSLQWFFWCQLAPLQDHLHLCRTIWCHQWHKNSEKTLDEIWESCCHTPEDWAFLHILGVFVTHIFSFPSSCMHFHLGVLLPRLKTLLTSCNLPRGPAFYRPFVKLAACRRCTVMIPPFFKKAMRSRAVRF